ncbi:MAG: SirB2 family protein [Gammaproteobacteria bacterium]|nr:MAG: SirB2 family protein [Gammaproteobacteria bacterium]
MRYGRVSLVTDIQRIIMAWVKSIHVLCALLSISGFIVRGIWMIQGSPQLQRRWVKIAPHIIDTILLGSAIILVVSLQQYPFVHGWLTAKVVALLLYIMLGVMALRPNHHRPQRIMAWCAALTVYAYIVAVAVTRQPVPLL